MTIYEKLEARLQHHKTRAEAIQFVLDELRETATTTAKARLNGRLEAAATLRKAAKNEQRTTRSARRAKLKSTKPKPRKGAFIQAALAALAEAKSPLATEELREAIEADLGVPIRGEGFGSLIRYGYAKLTKDGYVATGKAWGG